ncbi:MAG TPA: DUF456 domain-containing protein [Aestuariivirgaceae bacterium]|nr:DUF456 domain-containing protein [Aestuariivirgaceae bacterium]
MSETLLLWILAVALMAAGLAGLLLPLLPGAPLLFAGMLLGAWIDDFAYVGTGTLIVLGILAALTYIVDFAATAFGARRYGASARAAIGAVVGGLIGLFFGLAGILLGPFIGAVVGEFTKQNNLRAASRAGRGATLGLVFAAAGKIALGLTMLGLFALKRLL